MTVGENLFRQGDPTRGFVVVRSGRLALVRHTEYGESIILHTAEAGESAAEASLFSAAYHCDCIAKKSGKVIIVSKQATLRLVDAQPAFARALLSHLASQVIESRQRLELQAIPRAQDRVLAALVDGRHKGTIIELAASIGLSHEATYRALAKLVEQQLVNKCGRGKYVAARPSF